MSMLLILAFLFFIGSMIGWVIELFYHRYFIEGKITKKWINPGFCTGPYLPIYGGGLCILYLLASTEQWNMIPSVWGNKCVLFLVMMVCMTLLEFIAGLISVNCFHVRLWDYRMEWLNVKGIICPKYSLMWAALGALYYFFIHPYILDALEWLSQNLAFSFVIGVFFGVFTVDLVNSMQLLDRLKKFAGENHVVLEYESIKHSIRSYYTKTQQKYHFFHPFRTILPLNEHLLQYVRENLKEAKQNLGEKVKERIHK